MKNRNLTLIWKFWLFLVAVALLPALFLDYSTADWVMVGIALMGLAVCLVWWWTAFKPKQS